MPEADDNGVPGGPADRPVLAVDGLGVEFRSARRAVRAVDGVSFELRAGSALGLVGESGSGKSATGLAIAGLLPPGRGRVSAGIIRFGDRELTRLGAEAMRAIRGRHISVVFQDPLSALNPVRTIGFQLLEALGPEAGADPAARRAAAAELLGTVGIAEPAAMLRAYPHQLSGGMRQRVIIAIAITRRPEVLIADEPTTALDVTVQLQILGLLDDLRRERGMAMVLITHDFGVAASLCDELAVMYAGRIVERGPVEDVLVRPRHPYTVGLIGAVPRIDAPGAALAPIPGRPPNPACLAAGCAFAPRCPFAQPRCRAESPTETVLDSGRRYACHFPVDGART